MHNPEEILPLATLIIILWIVVGSILLITCIKLVGKHKEEPACSIIEILVEDPNVPVILVCSGILIMVTLLLLINSTA